MGTNCPATTSTQWNDKQNSNMKWRDDFVSKISQINKYKMFQDTDNAFDTRPPNKNKMICVHIVFDFKHDKQHNVQLKADGHLTNTPY
jgi:hypothetical protein